MTDDLRYIIEAALARSRSRTSWNDRLAHWERPASFHEEAKIERAARMVRNNISANAWLVGERVSVRPQGSYFNNTNVRLEADMDVRVQHPDLKVIYLDGADEPRADAVLGYALTGGTLGDTMAEMRAQLAGSLRRQFGAHRVDTSGNKAIRVDALDGSRADCDVVPAFTLQVVSETNGSYGSIAGVAILGKDGSWTLNFPEQHNFNGIEKRRRTAHRFKKVVRMLKRLNYELVDSGDIPSRMPSFFVECLVYRVEDIYFMNADDDRFSRLLRVLGRAWTLLNDQAWISSASEINDLKYLFHPNQAWTVDQARLFVASAIARLEAV